MSNEKHIENLNDLVSKENWSELTGPFFHVQISNHDMIGPIKAADLKQYQDQNPLPESTKIRDAKSLSGWQELYLHPLFQRRKPQVLNSTPQELNHIHILVDGQSHGPLSMDEVTNMITQNEIFLNDQVSFDGGQTWKKIFQVEQFDRRNFAQTELPAAPNWEVFRGSNDEISEELQSITKENIETDAIAGLAFIENINSGKTSQNHDRSYAQAQEQQSAEILDMPQMAMKAPQSSGPKFYYAMAIVLLLGASSFFFLNTPNSSRAPALSQSEKDGAKNSNASTKPRKRTNYKSPRLKAKRAARSRKPASIQESRSFRDANERRVMRDRASQNDDNPYPDDYDYDQGDSPVEQDPIRKKLDKTTIDPEENYYDDEEKEAFIDSQEDYDAAELTPDEVWGEDGRVPAGDVEQDEFGEPQYDDLDYENAEEVEFVESDY